VVGSDISSHPSGSASSVVVVSSILPIILFFDTAIDLLLAAVADAVADGDEEFFQPGGGSH
jgi:hypothetical protein